MTVANNHRNPDNPRVDFTPTGKPTKHGTPSTYNRGCRCEECRANHYERMCKTFENIRGKGLPEGDKRHGTINGYINYSCRCEPCKGAGAAKNKAAHAARKAGYTRKFIEPDTLERAKLRRVEEFESGKRKINHGTMTGYSNYKCRCVKCKKTASDYNKAWKARKRADKRDKLTEQGQGKEDQNGYSTG